MKRRIKQGVVTMCAFALVWALAMLASMRAGIAQESHEHGGDVYTAWENPTALPSTAGNYELTVDVTLGETWTTPEGETNICLSGHAIRADFDGADAASAILVREGATFSVIDDAGDGMLTVAEGRSVSVGVDVQGGAAFDLFGGTICGFGNGVFTNLQAKDSDHEQASYGTFNMSGGTIRDNSMHGVYVFSGTFDLSGGVICSNGSNGDNGAGVYVSYSAFHMSGGEIIDNNAPEDGGGAYLFRSEDLTMTGGNIGNNTAGGNGGGVYVNGGTFAVTRGTISGNTAAADGGGVCLASGTDNSKIGKLSLTGGEITKNVSTAGLGGGVYVTKESVLSIANMPIVAENVAGEVTSNVHLPGVTIAVEGKLEDVAAIGVTQTSGEGADAVASQADDADELPLTTGYAAAGNEADPSAYFNSDDEERVVVWTADSQEARLAKTYAVRVGKVTNGAIIPSKDRAYAGEQMSFDASPDEGYELESYEVRDATGSVVASTDREFVMPASDVTIDATFKKVDQASEGEDGQEQTGGDDKSNTGNTDNTGSAGNASTGNATPGTAPSTARQSIPYASMVSRNSSSNVPASMATRTLAKTADATPVCAIQFAMAAGCALVLGCTRRRRA